MARTRPSTATFPGSVREPIGLTPAGGFGRS